MPGDAIGLVARIRIILFVLFPYFVQAESTSQTKSSDSDEIVLSVNVRITLFRHMSNTLDILMSDASVSFSVGLTRPGDL